jgi:hypothetical protein
MVDEKQYSFAELTDIIGIIFQWGEKQGGFMERMMLAYQTADSSNKYIIHGAVEKLIRKYNLDKDCMALRLKNPDIAKASDDYLKAHEDDLR